MAEDHEGPDSLEGAQEPHKVIHAMEVVNQRYVLFILRELRGGQRAFNDLRRSIGISPNTLRERLKNLERNGIVTRTVQKRPRMVFFALTPNGKQLAVIVDSIQEWEHEWINSKHKGKRKGSPGLIDEADPNMPQV